MAKTKGDDKLAQKLDVARYAVFPKQNMSEVLDMTEMHFNGGQALRRLYHDSDRVIVVEYYKDRCSMCRVLRPLMKKVLSEFDSRVHFVEVEVLQNKDVIVQAGLNSVPTVHVFKRGMLVDSFHGLHAKSKLRQRFNDTLALYEHADDAVMQKAWDRARRKRSGAEDGMTYPLKHIYATGRVLYPAHWNSLFHSDRRTAREEQENKSSLDIFLDNSNCIGDDGHEVFYIEALRKGRISGSGVVGRISDGESNIQYGEEDEETTDIPIPDKAGRIVHQICDATGCTLIIKHSEE